MRILYVITQSSWGGAQKYVYSLASELSRDHKHEITVAGGKESLGALSIKLTEDGVKFTAVKHLIRSVNLIEDILAVWELKKMIETEKPDIVHLNSSKAGAVGSFAARLARHRAKVVYTVHGWVFNEDINPLIKFFYFLIEKATARFKDRFICISDKDRYSGIGKKIALAEKFSTIRNGIDAAAMDFLSQEEARKKLLGNSLATESKIVIGTIANFYPTKGLNYLIDAINILINDFKVPIIAVIIGDGELRTQLETQIKNKGLEKNIILAGKITNAAEYLRELDIAVMSSVKEGAPFFLLEAMAAGLPIVATKVGGIPEIVEDNITGLLAAPKNPKDLAEKIRRLAEDGDLRAKMGQAGLDRVKNNFSQEKMIADTLALYEKI